MTVLAVEGPTGTVASVVVMIEQGGEQEGQEMPPPRARLTAREMIASDVAIRRDALNEINFTFRLYAPLLDRKEYAIVRSQLRTEPAFSLRKTCRNLKKYLDSPEKQAKFDRVYDELIDATTELDVRCLKRLQGEGVPGQGVADAELQGVLKRALAAFDEMLDLAQ